MILCEYATETDSFHVTREIITMGFHFCCLAYEVVRIEEKI